MTPERDTMPANPTTATPAAPAAPVYMLDAPVFVSPGDSATLKRLGLPASSTIYNLVAEKRLTARKVGNATYVETADIIALIRQSPAAELNRQLPKPKTAKTA